jgi:hypothetical protein
MDPIPDGAHTVGAPLRPPSGRPPLRAHRVSSPDANPASTKSTTRPPAELPYHPHIQHEGTKSTEIYLHADNKLKQQAIDRTTPTGTPPGRYKPPDRLLAFLERL